MKRDLSRISNGQLSKMSANSYCPNVNFGEGLSWTPAMPWGSCGFSDLHYVNFCLDSLGSNY